MFEKEPLEFKRLSKLDPRRLLFSAFRLLVEQEAKYNFERYNLPYKEIPDLTSIEHRIKAGHTYVATQQYQYLYSAVKTVEAKLGPLPIVEIGAYHGVTACFFAEHSSAKIFAVDSYIGFGGSNDDLQIFFKN